jgi:hypothetical protein
MLSKLTDYSKDPTTAERGVSQMIIIRPHVM